MASYNDGDSFDRMQREAVERVREMQRRAQSFTDSHRPEPHGQAHDIPVPPHSPDEPKDKGGLLPSLLSDIKIDEEKALIGLLIYVLYKNGCDTKLMLALGYLLL